VPFQDENILKKMAKKIIKLAYTKFFISLIFFQYPYQKLIGQAENWALKESGVQIILCTCAASGSPRLAKTCDNIQQCIVDECGMCMEPESLVPITCSGARQVVLIGDHKQLQPVVQDQVAKTLGLSVSMFERHSNRAKMLALQYRMVSSIKHVSIKYKNRHSVERGCQFCPKLHKWGNRV